MPVVLLLVLVALLWAWGRLVVVLPPGATRVALQYAPPWSKGLVLGAVAALLAFALAGATLRRRRQPC